MTNEIYANMQKHGTNLSEYATKDEEVTYLKNIDGDIRTPFFRDIDKVIYSLAYLRYMDKTQVFTYKKNDHLQKRMIHVQYVSKIARTIGRALGLNEDLIEAAALGHDLGHTPYGHLGERIINKISLELNEGYFNHNINSVRVLKNIENFGRGLNVSVQVLDAIMCHNGEFVKNEYYPKKKSKEEFLKEYDNCYQDEDVIKHLHPMTLEGCVVRICDIIGYLGRDIEDASRMHLVSFKDIPENITNVLGKNNSDIINTIVLDVIKNSFNKPYIKMSDNVYKAICDLKDFNSKNIYSKSVTDEETIIIENMFRTLIKKYIEDIKNNKTDEVIFTSYLNNMAKEYKEENTPERIAIDYVAGMTDDFFKNQYEQIINKK